MPYISVITLNFEQFNYTFLEGTTGSVCLTITNPITLAEDTQFNIILSGEYLLTHAEMVFYRFDVHIYLTPPSRIA